MKSDQELMQSIRAAIDDCTRGIDQAPSLQCQIARKAKGEEPVVKKISASAIFVIVLILVSMTAALAAGLGLFGELAQDRDADDRLTALEKASEPLSASMRTEDGIIIEIGQAYYEGSRVFLSYRLSGNLYSIALHEGAPEEEYPWNDVLENTIAAETWGSDIPELQQGIDWLDGKGRRWTESREAALHDGLYLEDGTYLDIIGGEEQIQPDGSILGWKECEIPSSCVRETLTFKAVLFRTQEVAFQDGTTWKRYVERGENTDVFFTLRHNDRIVYLKGAAETDTYRAAAELASGKVDIKGEIRLEAPESWVKIWNTWENEAGLDIVEQWNLYRKGQLISREGTQSVQIKGTTDICFELLYPRMEQIDGLTLVPVYSQSGEHPDEAISIERIAQ